MRNFTHRWPQSGQSSPKLGHFFPIFGKGQGRTPLKINRKFSFQFATEDTLKNVVKNLPSDKATAGEIFVDIFKIQSFALVS